MAQVAYLTKAFGLTNYVFKSQASLVPKLFQNLFKYPHFVPPPSCTDAYDIYTVYGKNVKCGKYHRELFNFYRVRVVTLEDLHLFQKTNCKIIPHVYKFPSCISETATKAYLYSQFASRPFWRNYLYSQETPRFPLVTIGSNLSVIHRYICEDVENSGIIIPKLAEIIGTSDFKIRSMYDDYFHRCQTLGLDHYPDKYSSLLKEALESSHGSKLRKLIEEADKRSKECLPMFKELEVYEKDPESEEDAMTAYG